MHVIISVLISIYLLDVVVVTTLSLLIASPIRLIYLAILFYSKNLQSLMYEITFKDIYKMFNIYKFYFIFVLFSRVKFNVSLKLVN
jgi:hypothetical protein